jgi:hypothetical protein
VAEVENPAGEGAGLEENDGGLDLREEFAEFLA